jgi:hypothetical protein
VSDLPTDKEIALALGYQFSEEGFERRGPNGEMYLRAYWKSPKGQFCLDFQPDFTWNLNSALQCWQALPAPNEWELRWNEARSEWQFVHRHGDRIQWWDGANPATAICAAFKEHVMDK